MEVDGKDLLGAVEAQRNGALNELATTEAMLVARNRRIAALEAEVAALKAAAEQPKD